ISSSSQVLVEGATLDVSALTSPTLMNSVTLSNATVKLGTTNLATPMVVSGLSTLGAGNTISTPALPIIASYPASIPLIQATSTVISGLHATIGSLPAGGYVGTIGLSADQLTVVLNLTAGPVGQRSSVLWTGGDVSNLNTNWSDRLNWQLPGTPGIGD